MTHTPMRIRTCILVYAYVRVSILVCVYTYTRIVQVLLAHFGSLIFELHCSLTFDQTFVFLYCLWFNKLIVSLKSVIKILKKFFECLKTQYSKLKP